MDTGPKAAGSGADDTGVGTTIWSNPTRVVASDNSYATNAVASVGGISHFLKTSAHSLGVPAGATPTGIQVNIERKGSGLVDYQVSLVRAGVVEAVDRSSPTTWTGSDVTASYGGASDLWGASWTVAELNNSGWGIAIAVLNNTNFGITASVDYIEAIAYYTPASAGGNKMRMVI